MMTSKSGSARLICITCLSCRCRLLDPRGCCPISGWSAFCHWRMGANYRPKQGLLILLGRTIQPVSACRCVVDRQEECGHVPQINQLLGGWPNRRILHDLFLDCFGQVGLWGDIAIGFDELRKQRRQIRIARIAFEILNAQTPIEGLHTRQHLRKLHEIAKQGVVDVVSRFLLLHDGATLDVALLPNLSLSPSSEWHERAGADDAAQQGPSVHCGAYQSDPAVLPFLFHDSLLNCFAESAILRAKSHLARCVLIKAEA